MTVHMTNRLKQNTQRESHRQKHPFCASILDSLHRNLLTRQLQNNWGLTLLGSPPSRVHLNSKYRLMMRDLIGNSHCSKIASLIFPVWFGSFLCSVCQKDAIPVIITITSASKVTHDSQASASVEAGKQSLSSLLLNL